MGLCWEGAEGLPKGGEGRPQKQGEVHQARLYYINHGPSHVMKYYAAIKNHRGECYGHLKMLKARY